jgi:hypothetical protein
MARDDFTKPTITKLAQRAGYTCSMCDVLTVGPSSETGESVNITGVAAHISGASDGRGSRRYRELMETVDRKNISNGIWLCEKHADLIDGDEITYTEDGLLKIKKKHEAKIQFRHQGINVDIGCFTEIEIFNLATFKTLTKIKFKQNNLIIGQGSPGKTILCEFLASLKHPGLLKRWEDSKNEGNSFFKIKYFRTEELNYDVKINSKREISYDLNGVSTPVLIAPSTIFYLRKSYSEFVRENDFQNKISESFSKYFDLRNIEFSNFITEISTKEKFFISDFIYYSDDDYLKIKLNSKKDFQNFQTLSSGEMQTFLLEMSLQLAIFYSRFNSTTMIIDQNAFSSLDSAGYSNLIKVIVKNKFSFQFILAIFFEKNELPTNLLNTIELKVENGETKIL